MWPSAYFTEQNTCGIYFTFSASKSIPLSRGLLYFAKHSGHIQRFDAIANLQPFQSLSFTFGEGVLPQLQHRPIYLTFSSYGDLLPHSSHSQNRRISFPSPPTSLRSRVLPLHQKHSPSYWFSIGSIYLTFSLGCQ